MTSLLFFPRFSFVKKGVFKEKNLYCSCVSKGKYSGRIVIDSVFSIDTFLNQIVTVGYRNEKIGKWEYFDLADNEMLRSVSYSNKGVLLNERRFTLDSINDFIYDSLSNEMIVDSIGN